MQFENRPRSAYMIFYDRMNKLLLKFYDKPVHDKTMEISKLWKEYRDNGLLDIYEEAAQKEKEQFKPNYNIADYLKLPKYFSEIVNNSNKLNTQKMYNLLRSKYEQNQSKYDDQEDKSDCVTYIKDILFIFENEGLNKMEKKVMAIYLFHLLDTERMCGFRAHYPKFNSTVYGKINEFYYETCEYFSAYIKTNFEKDKYYLSRQKNKSF